jgi:hypothetical protein
MALALGIPVPQVVWRAGGVGADTASGHALDLAALATRSVTVETVNETGSAKRHMGASMRKR